MCAAPRGAFLAEPTRRHHHDSGGRCCYCHDRNPHNIHDPNAMDGMYDRFIETFGSPVPIQNTRIYHSITDISRVYSPREGKYSLG